MYDIVFLPNFKYVVIKPARGATSGCFFTAARVGEDERG